MKLSQTATYACLAILHLAEQRGQFVATRAIARAQAIPARYLEKVLRPLVALGWVQSRKGPGGGYRLRQRPEAMSLLEVIEALDGPLGGLVPGNDAPAVRALEAACATVASGTRAELAAWTFDRLAKRVALGK